jgi:serine/threonine-protein kinase
MVQKDGTVKVMDFGIAKVIEALNQTNTQSVGTLQYMSPEQIDAHTIDHRSDLYCLGLIFYELVAGHPPFQSASPRQLLNLQCTADAPPLPDEVRSGLPKGVEQLLFQLLEKAPEDRPYFAQDVIDRLEPFQTAASPNAAGRGSSLGRGGSPSKSGLSSPAITPPRTPSSSSLNDGAASGSLPRRSSGAVQERAPSSPGADASEAAPPRVQRADTIALVDQVDKPREISNKLAIAIIVGLSALAGIGAYIVRATSSAPDTPAGGPTASIPSTAAPPPRGPGPR